MQQRTRRWLLLLPIALLVRPAEARKPDRNERKLTPEDIACAETQSFDWCRDPFIDQYHIWYDCICPDCGRTDQVLTVVFPDKVFIARWNDYLQTRRNRTLNLHFSHICDLEFGRFMK